jgi:urease beta subunit
VSSGVTPGEVVVADSPAPAPDEDRSGSVTVTNRGRFPAYLTSHFPIERASPTLEFDREGLAGARPRLPSGASTEIPPGESIDVAVTWD